MALTAAAILLAAGGVLFWRAADRAPYNVLLISIDTCRADHLSCYGYPRKTTPHLDALAREGFRFHNVLTPVPMTLPAHCSMLTGTVPPYHGVHGNNAYQLQGSNLTLPEILRQHGYATGAAVGSFVLDSQFGMDQGFDTYDDDFGVEGTTTATTQFNTRTAEEVNRVVLPWLKSHGDRPFFYFVHYYDPHHPYEPPPPFGSIFVDSLYDGEIAYTDHQIGELIGELKRLDLYDSTMIIVTSDHGEGLGEHGESTHSYYIYHSTTKVPLIIKPPHSRTSRVIDETAGLVDIVPTVLSSLRLPLPDVLHGESLTRFFGGDAGPKSVRHFYCESLMAATFNCNSLLSMENPSLKYIHTTRPEVYDLVQDAREELNRFDQQPAEARQLRNRLQAYLSDHTRTGEEDGAAIPDRESVERIEGLGYVQGASRPTLEFDDTKEDPKDFLPLFEKLIVAGELMHRRPAGPARMTTDMRVEAARRLLFEVLEARPDNVNAHGMLAKIAVDAQDLDRAAEHYQELVRIDPTSAAARNDLGNVRMSQGRIDEAMALYEEAVRLAHAATDDATTFNRALTQFSRADQVIYEARFSLAGAFIRRGEFERAEALYREVLALRQPRAHVKAEAYHRLGLLMAKLGRDDEASAMHRKALELKPDHAAAKRALDAGKGPASPTGG